MLKYLFGAVLVFASAGGLMANQITFVGGAGSGAHQSGQGGAFTVQPDQPLSWVLNYYSPLARNVGGTVGTFQTFCVEKNEAMHPGTVYDVVLNMQTELTGVPLTQGAAWLYYNFATGGLAQYDYANGTQAADLQNALWWLMGQSGYVNNVFSQLVVSSLGTQAALAGSDGTYPVQVMNLWTPGHVGNERYAAQDQLVLTGFAVPDPASTFLLLALSFSMVLMTRKCQSGF